MARSETWHSTWLDALCHFHGCCNKWISVAWVPVSSWIILRYLVKQNKRTGTKEETKVLWKFFQGKLSLLLEPYPSRLDAMDKSCWAQTPCEGKAAVSMQPGKPLFKGWTVLRSSYIWMQWVPGAFQGFLRWRPADGSKDQDAGNMAMAKDGSHWGCLVWKK